MVVEVGAAEQPVVPLPVVFGAEGVVDADETAATADVLQQRGLLGVVEGVTVAAEVDGTGQAE